MREYATVMKLLTVPPPLCCALKQRQADEAKTRQAMEGVEAPSYDGNGENPKQKSEESSLLCPPPNESLPSGTTDEKQGGPSTFVLPVLTSWRDKIGIAVGALFFTVVGVVGGRWSATRSGYLSLPGPA